MNCMRFGFIVAVLVVALVSHSEAAAILECPEHSTFNGCMTRCPVTCLNLNNPPTNCISVCTVGCECMEGFVKLNKGATAQCVKSYECSMYTSKTQTLPYPVLRKLAAAASVPSNNARFNLTTISMVGLTSHTKSTSAKTSTIPAAILSKRVKHQQPEENESHEQ